MGKNNGKINSNFVCMVKDFALARTTGERYFRFIIHYSMKIE